MVHGMTPASRASGNASAAAVATGEARCAACFNLFNCGLAADCPYHGRRGADPCDAGARDAVHLARLLVAIYRMTAAGRQAPCGLARRRLAAVLDVYDLMRPQRGKTVSVRALVAAHLARQDRPAWHDPLQGCPDVAVTPHAAVVLALFLADLAHSGAGYPTRPATQLRWHRHGCTGIRLTWTHTGARRVISFPDAAVCHLIAGAPLNGELNLTGCKSGLLFSLALSNALA